MPCERCMCGNNCGSFILCRTCFTRGLLPAQYRQEPFALYPSARFECLCFGCMFGAHGKCIDARDPLVPGCIFPNDPMPSSICR